MASVYHLYRLHTDDKLDYTHTHTHRCSPKPHPHRHSIQDGTLSLYTTVYEHDSRYHLSNHHRFRPQIILSNHPLQATHIPTKLLWTSKNWSTNQQEGQPVCSSHHPEVRGVPKTCDQVSTSNSEIESLTLSL